MVVLAAAFAVATLARQARDVGGQLSAPAAISGTGVLTGRVVTDTTPPRPVRRATVRLIGAAGSSTRLAGTDDEGKFTFDALPGGSFTLSASKTGLVQAFHGSTHPGRGPGIPIAVADGARVEATLRMAPGATITGTIADAAGTPTPGVTVFAVAQRATSGTQTIRANTDDRGVYRIFGLAPGEYVVSASPRLASPSGRGMLGNDVIAVTEAEVRWALATGSGRGPIPRVGQLVAYAPVYHPGTTDLASASTIALRAGEERTGVNMITRLVAVATIAGTLVDVEGRGVEAATVSLFPRRRDRPTPADLLVSSGALLLPRGSVTPGRFTIPGIPPGDYTIVARSGSGMRSTQPPPPSGPVALWNVTDITVDGNDRSDLVLRMLPGLRLTGSIVFERSVAAAPEDLSTIELTLTATGSNLGTASAPRAIVERAGGFRFLSIPPGTYRLDVLLPSTAANTAWTLKSAIVKERDLADHRLDVTASGEEFDGLVVTFTDRAAEISGRLVDDGGQPVTRYSVVVVSTDRAYWWPGARRVRAVRPATDGSFRVTGLAPGEYAIAAAEDVEVVDLADPAFLAQFVSVGFKLSVAAGDKKQQNLRVGR
jgi:hypothetical protein